MENLICALCSGRHGPAECEVAQRVIASQWRAPSPVQRVPVSTPAKMALREQEDLERDREVTRFDPQPVAYWREHGKFASRAIVSV